MIFFTYGLLTTAAYYLRVILADKTHLLAVPEDLNKLYQDEFGEVVIPCRPTTPDVNVTLLKANEVISDYSYYDDKKGYLLRSLFIGGPIEYNCEANKKNINEYRRFNVFSNPNVTQINIDAEYSDTIVIGQNVSLNCSVTTLLDTSFKLSWKLTDKQKLKAQQLPVVEQTFIDNFKFKVYSLLLHIHNVRTEDDGVYVCKVKTHSGRITNATFHLKAVESDTYLNLKIIDGNSKIIRPVGFKSVKWIIQVLAYPNANHKWVDGYGKEVMSVPKKIRLSNSKNTTELQITNLKLSDSQMYKLIADNGVYQKQIAVTLTVKGKPTASIVSEDTTRADEVGKSYNMKCIADGIPLPKIEWSFKNCFYDTYLVMQCDSHSEAPIFQFINNIIRFESSKLEVIAAIDFNVTQFGILICKTSNDLGNFVSEKNVLATDLSHDLEIKGPQEVEVGNTLTIECGASKHLYRNAVIKWNHFDVQYRTNAMNNNDNFIMTKNQTRFSYRSYLTIINITKMYSGTFDCLADERSASSYAYTPDKKSLKLRVVNPYAPVIYNKSNLYSKALTGEQVQWWCYARGIPSPSIYWYKDNRLLQFTEDNRRLLLLDKNQTLKITSAELEDNGSYTCRVSNKKGSVVSINTLTVTDERGMQERRMFILFYSVTAILLGLLVLVCVMYSKRRRKWKTELALANLRFENGAIETWNPDLSIEEQAELLPYDKKWEFPTNKLKLGKKLGFGAFGVVYKAEAMGILDKDIITTVAVKTIKPNTNVFYKNALASELKTMGYIGKHLNVINLLGACTGNVTRNLMVIVEYCRFGNIQQYILKRRDCFVDQFTPDGSIDYEMKTSSDNLDYENIRNKITLSKNRKNEPNLSSNYGLNIYSQTSNYHEGNDSDITEPLCTNDLICWSFQISRGMAYLAGKKILHGDLAARNILLADENIVKICDFGLSKTMYNSDNYKKKSDKDYLPVRWMAIESLRDRVFSTQSDVWSFGIVLWEMFSLAVTPYPNIQSVNDLYGSLIEGYRMEQPIYSNSEIYGIMLDCWAMSPSSRPSFNDLADRLGMLLERGTKTFYIQLNEEHIKMNGKGPSIDYINLVKSLTYENCLPSTSENNTHSALMNKDDLELKPVLY